MLKSDVLLVLSYRPRGVINVKYTQVKQFFHERLRELAGGSFRGRETHRILSIERLHKKLSSQILSQLYSRT